MPTKKTGRRLKLTSTLQEQLCLLIARGHYATTAAASVGIGEATFYRWMELGEDHVEVQRGRRVLIKARAPFQEFREAVEKSRAQAQMLHMEAIREAAFEVIPTADGRQKVRCKNWTASAWYLERTAPEKFARREVVHAGEGPTPQNPDDGDRPKVVRFGGRYRPDGQLQTSALKAPEDR